MIVTPPSRVKSSGVVAVTVVGGQRGRRAEAGLRERPPPHLQSLSPLGGERGG
ncbi:MAG: hypothetical protein PHX35_00935 [Candidatus Bipolaricaulis anaerobius]|nr:hypothetical protein [Candidatus Bipolaricaulis anaerobius]